MHYRIRIAGYLDLSWQEWFHQLEILHESGATLLQGPLEDQAALYSLLFKIRHHGLTLLSLDTDMREGQRECVEEKEQ
jgi:hypothetical protein